MKSLLIGINAKYIHPNLAIRLLKENTSYDTKIKEFNIKDNSNDIVSFILNGNYDVVGFSSYIWNIELIKKVIKNLREKSKKIIIVLGGPEVSYNPNDYLDIANFVIKNEGEVAWDKLLHFLDGKCSLNEVPNLYHREGFTHYEIIDVTKIKTAYDKLADTKNQITYFETSRGCPYHCAYCMASLDNKVRFFDMDVIKTDLLKLLDSGARVIKFLDRTFNANKKKFIELVLFLIEHHKPHNSFQFEITGDLLDDDIIEFIHERAPKNLFRFEIGIQSTNILSNKLVYRIQNNEKLFHNIKLIQEKGIIDLHLDLIAGLPKEDYKSFENTFNEVLSLRPKELQLGFLKLLHGTKLEEECHLYSYEFSKTAPYEIIRNDSLSEKDIENIHIVEDSFEKYYNHGYMNKSIRFILDKIDNPFQFFFELGSYSMNNKTEGLHGLYQTLDEFLKTKGYSFYNDAHISLLIDYLSYNKCKAKAWWDITPNKNDLIRYVYNKNICPFTLDILYKYAQVIEYKNTLIVALYIDNKSYVYSLTKNKE